MQVRNNYYGQVESEFRGLLLACEHFLANESKGYLKEYMLKNFAHLFDPYILEAFLRDYITEDQE